ncbi:hypothetical protein T265_12072 [Opisthorchis viverrini]|uniref:Oxysterol-binding protein n=1 Tax=Opisthorchis viverrini TaxID=6198 RepID=A0A074Z6W1_OPIVI|nr:hypothetical protein T265_12072 [Opisthorchis viverrini]KER18975.1 hypothetical protein T265_12072 [Opisthorchis viverrini]
MNYTHTDKFVPHQPSHGAISRVALLVASSSVYLAAFNVNTLKQAGQQNTLALTLDSLGSDVCYVTETIIHDASTMIKLIALSVAIRFRQRASRSKASEENLVDLEYADDIVLMFAEKDKAQVFLDELTKVIPSFGMHFASTKCKVMLVDVQSLNTPLTIQGEALDIVERFTYLGSCISSDCSVTDEPNADGANDLKSEVVSTTLCASPGSGRGSCTGDEQSVGSQESRGSDQWMDSGVFPSPILNMDSEAVSLPVLPGDAQPDEPFEETELGSIEQQKHVVLHLLSQLKLGMDLTKIVLPTFILEKRSILEMFADYLAHPDLFVNINRGEDPEARMIAFVQWYLTAFHAGRKDKVAKKPYNPIIGESFHCCWPISSMGSPNSSPPVASISTSNANAPSTENTDLPNVITYCAEQVSHHPPVTAFHIELPSEQMELNCFVHAKSKFQGMSVSVTMLGKTVLRLGHHNNEEYHFAFPTAYARSILTVPWVELGDRVTIACPQTGYSACVIFHTKPIRSNKLHRVSAEIYAPQAADASAIDRGASPTNLVARVSGEWNSVLEFEGYTKGGKKWSIDVNTLKIMRKHVRPIDKQRPEESRRLWQHVTNALKSGNLQLATEKKREVSMFTTSLP